MDKLPLISIGVSAYNRENFLPACLDSLLAQSYKNCEIIVVDDGSNDNTRQLVEEKYPQVRYIYKNNGGDASAKNRAAQEAKGEYIVFNDSDDLFLPDAVEKLYAAILKGQKEYNSEVIAYGLYSGIDENGNPQTVRAKVADYPSGKITGALLDHVLVSSAGTLMPRQTFIDAGGYDETLRCMHDWKSSLELSLKLPFIAVNEPVFLRRRHSSNLSSASYNGTATGLKVFEDFIAAHREVKTDFSKKIKRRRSVFHSRLAREARKSGMPESIIKAHLAAALENHFSLKNLFRYLAIII